MDLEQEYSPSSRVGGSSDPFVADYVRRTDADYTAPNAQYDEMIAFTLRHFNGVKKP